MTIRSILVAIVVLTIGAGGFAQEGGGTGILNERVPEEGVLFGGQPTAQQLQALARAEYKTVIDLRGEGEDRGFDETQALKATGLEYLTLPMTRETMSTHATWDTFIEMFRNAEKPVLVHCASGGRVGAAYYAYLVAEEGMSRAAAREKSGLTTDRLAAPVDSYLDAKGE